MRSYLNKEEKQTTTLLKPTVWLLAPKHQPHHVFHQSFYPTASKKAVSNKAETSRQEKKRLGNGHTPQPPMKCSQSNMANLEESLPGPK